MLPLTPTRLGRYEIVDEIGKGAMGVVYLARDPLIGRLVALKTFRIGYSVKDQELEQFRVRFMREAQSAGILTHPNIVTIHDVVEASEEGLAFIAMEYVRGTNLKLMLQGEQPLSPRFVLDILSQVGEALDYAHANRVIHRDVKPANILITADNRVKITDFGIARLDSSNLTQEGQLLGTPNYMAPEQIQGREVDHRADLFSLGVVLYEMFTRHKPFQGENLTVVSHRIVYDHFTSPRDYAADLPLGVDRILAKALEKDPARRYQRAREMVDELRKVVDSVARDNLNETQSLSSTMVVPLAPAPPPPPKAPKPSLFSRWRRAPAPPPPASGSQATEGSSASSLPPPLPVAAPPPPPAAMLDDTVPTGQAVVPAPPRRGASARRWLAAAGILVVAVILAGAAFQLWRSWSQPAPVQRSAGETRQRQVLALIEQGHKAMRAGEFDLAVALYAQAEQLDPSRDDLERLRLAAEWQRQDFKAQIDQNQEIGKSLADAKRALAERRYNHALALLTIVLASEPKNQEALALQAEVREARANLPARPGSAPVRPGTPGSEEVVATATPAPGEVQPGGVGEPTPAVAREAKLQIRFQSEIAGTLIVRVDGEERVRKTFRSGGLGGLLRSRKEEDRSFGETIELPPGRHEIVIHVAPQGKAAQVKEYNENFLQGSSRHLEIYLSKSEQMTADLN